MKMTRQPLILAVSLVAVLALSACGKQDESASNAPATPPPAAAPAPTPATTPAPAPAMVSFTSVELGSTIDASNKIAASGTSFAPKDTIYASVDTSGSGNATLAAKWSYQDGQVVHEDSKTLNAMGPETTAFMISKPSGFPAGNYKVDISLNGTQVASKDFSVK
jgi:multidrug efflux pump subunit AcrA (membrane-fusion protein)